MLYLCAQNSQMYIIKKNKRLMKTFHLFFEQSGTFKNAFKKLGYNAIDYDINNEYNKTDCIIDLFENYEEIIEQYVKSDDTIIAFFPCTYFSDQQTLWLNGNNYSQRNWTDLEKIKYSKETIQKLNTYYYILCELIEICTIKNINLIIENPYSPNSFLIRYLPIKPDIIDKDRRRLGDKFIKPTMWYFIGKKPNDNFELLYPNLFTKQYIQHTKYGKERSEITSNYAENFIKIYIL